MYIKHKRLDELVMWKEEIDENNKNLLEYIET